MISRIINISTNKYERYASFIEENKEKISEKQISRMDMLNVHNPKEQIKTILENIAQTFFVITKEVNMKHQDIVVTLAYNLNKEWKWIEISNVNNGTSLKDLIEKQESTLYKVINGKSSYIFHPSKKAAEESKEYVFDERDEDNLEVGSIVCKRINCVNNIIGILSISTYGHQIVNDRADINQIRSVIKNILHPFEKRIMEELMLLYIDGFN